MHLYRGRPFRLLTREYSFDLGLGEEEDKIGAEQFPHSVEHDAAAGRYD